MKRSIAAFPARLPPGHHSADQPGPQIIFPLLGRGTAADYSASRGGRRWLQSALEVPALLCLASLALAAESIGDGHWFVEKSTKYATERIVFDQPIGRNQGVQFPIARAYVDARIVKIAGGSIEIMKTIIARQMFAQRGFALTKTG